VSHARRTISTMGWLRIVLPVATPTRKHKDPHEITKGRKTFSTHRNVNSVPEEELWPSEDSMCKEK
jgi:hypothetical protein